MLNDVAYLGVRVVSAAESSGSEPEGFMDILDARHVEVDRVRPLDRLMERSSERRATLNSAPRDAAHGPLAIRSGPGQRAHHLVEGVKPERNVPCPDFDPVRDPANSNSPA